jgi:hypothetical protein
MNIVLPVRAFISIENHDYKQFKYLRRRFIISDVILLNRSTQKKYSLKKELILSDILIN